MNWFTNKNKANKGWLGTHNTDKKGRKHSGGYSLFQPQGRGSYGQGNMWDDYDTGAGWFIKPPEDEMVVKLKATPKSTRSVDRFSYDAQEFNRTAESNYTMRGVAKRGEKIHKDFPILVEDVFNAFHKGHPVIKSDKNLDDFGMFSKGIIEAMLENHKYDALRKTTKWDRLYSAWATRTLDELFKNAGGGGAGKSGEKGGQETGEAADDDESEGEGEGSGEGSGGGSGEEGKEEEGGGSQATQLTDEQKEAIANAVDTFMDQALEEVADAEQRAAKWGLGAGSGSKVPDDQIDELLNLLEHAPSVDSLTAMIGRVHSIMNDVESESKSLTHGAPVGYTLGDELTRMAPQEFINLAHPGLKQDLRRRMYEHGIQVTERESTEAMGHGPMIVLLDGSQSMVTNRNQDKSSRITWGIAMAVMLFRRAMETGQPFVLHKFSGSTRSFKYENPSRQYADFIKEVMVIENGGTEIGKALQATQDSLTEFPEADIVILSDAELERNFYEEGDEQIVEFKRVTDAAQCKVIGVLINECTDKPWWCRNNEGDEMTLLTPYELMCHAAFQINPSDSDMIHDVTKDVFRQVIL